MRSLKVSGIIHLFAVLHAAVALLCRVAGVHDELVLTLLTIVMIVLICLKRGLNVEFTASCVIVVNVIGYLLGTGGAALIERIVRSPLAVHAVSTFLTTEILGWGITGSPASCGAAMRRSVVKGVLLLIFVLLTTACVALLAGLHLPFGFDRSFSWREFFQLSILTLLVEMTLYSLIFMIDYALVARSVLRVERGRTHQAQFLYMKLKQQVNPHFLFNSLNILDCLVCEQRTEQASAYIRKLAGIYRYMLQNEQESLVRLKEEMDFVGMYVDLLQVRFPDGFRVETDLADEALMRSIVPCSVQLLIENAIKHNAVDAASPLVIRITATAESVTVANDLRPKLPASASSTHVGLNYIRQQYLDLAGRPIVIEQTETLYRVTLPLL